MVHEQGEKVMEHFNPDRAKGEATGRARKRDEHRMTFEKGSTGNGDIHVHFFAVTTGCNSTLSFNCLSSFSFFTPLVTCSFLFQVLTKGSSFKDKRVKGKGLVHSNLLGKQAFASARSGRGEKTSLEEGERRWN